MKRFWTEVSIDATGVVRLDGKPVRTPGRVPLALPTDAMADAVAEEWRTVGAEIDPLAMPLTGLANAAIDVIAPDPLAFAGRLARYAESDLLCYRADAPAPLVARQAAAWDPLLAWARHRYDVHFEIATGVMHRAQPPATIAQLGDAVAALNPFHLAALSPIVTISGSLVAGLALIERAAEPDDVWLASELDEEWQAEQWGRDPLAEAPRATRRRDFEAGARFLRLLDA